MKYRALLPLLALVAFLLIPAISRAQDVEPASTPAEFTDNLPKIPTTANWGTAVPTEALAVLVNSMTQEQLEKEAQNWMDLVQMKQREISVCEAALLGIDWYLEFEREHGQLGGKIPKPHPMATFHMSDEPTTTVVVIEKQGDEPTTGTIPSILDMDEDAIVKKMSKARTEKTALIDRLNVILKEWEEKGGDPSSQRQYVKAISGLNVDVSDVKQAGMLWTLSLEWLKSPEGGIRWAVNIIQFCFWVFFFFVLSRLVGRIVQKAFKATRASSSLLQEFMVKSARRVVIFIGLLVGLSQLEVNIGPLLAMLGAAGFVIGFALQDTLGNFASGIMILFYRPFDTGDIVDTGGILGKVHSLNLVSVTIKTPDNKTVIIPNNSIWQGVITNATASNTRRVDLTFGIGYSDDIGKAQSILESIVAEHELTLDTPEPVIKLHELADSSVNFIVRPWVKTADYWTVYWDITRLVKERFDAEGVSIPFPQRDVHLFQESAK